MDTRTGEIFNLDAAGQLVPNPAQQQAEVLAAQLRLEEAQARGDLVPVSDKVAQLIHDGERAQRERKRKRKRRLKSQRDARKRARQSKSK
jgi:hypothetical protein